MADRDPLALLSLREAAGILGLDWKVVRELVESGQIGAYRTGASQQPRIPRRALEVWQERIAEGLVGNHVSNPGPGSYRAAPRRTASPNGTLVRRVVTK